MLIGTSDLFGRPSIITFYLQGPTQSDEDGIGGSSSDDDVSGGVRVFGGVWLIWSSGCEGYHMVLPLKSPVFVSLCIVSTLACSVPQSPQTVMTLGRGVKSWAEGKMK